MLYFRDCAMMKLYVQILEHPDNYPRPMLEAKRHSLARDRDV
jgi:hypothetical protein